MRVGWEHAMDPMFLVKSVLIPFALAAVVVGVAWLRSRRASGTTLVRLAGPLAVAVAFIVGVPMILGRVPEWKPAQAAEWLPYLGLVALAIGVIDAMLPRKVWAGVVVGALLAGFAWASLEGPLASAVARIKGEPGGSALPWLMGLMIVVPALAGRAGAKHTANAGPVFALGLMTACSIAGVLLSGTAMFAQVVALLGLGLAPIGVATLIRRPWVSDRGLIVTFASLHSLMWLVTHFYATKDGVWAATALFCVAPAGLVIARVPALAKRPKLAGVAQICAVLAMGVAGAATIVATQPAPAAGEADVSDLYK